MFEKIKFYLRHSLNDMRVNGQRTFFALLCIAAGVSAIVSLQTLAVMAGDSMNSAVQETNRGDIRIMPTPRTIRQIRADGRVTTRTAAPEESEGRTEVRNESFLGIGFPTRVFTAKGLDELRTWIDTKFPGVLESMSYRQYLSSILTAAMTSKDSSASLITPYVIDKAAYPLYGKLLTVDGKKLADVLKAPTDVVISKTLSDKLGVQVGDVVRISGSSSDFTVAAIVPNEAEGGLENLGAGLFGYFYLDFASMKLFANPTVDAEMIFWKLKDPSRVTEINNALADEYPFFRTTTTDDLREQNQKTAVVLNQLVTVMGLVSLLIGGIGIVNTMQVVVRRRTVEIAVLKTIGLQANQITVLFLVEAFLLGFIGSIGGIILGWAMAFILRGVAEAFLSQTLTFHLALGPAVAGLSVGTLVTTVFGFLPTLSAGQVRPGVVLRPNDSVVMQAGCGRTLAALILVIISIALIAQTIVGSLTTALIAVVGAFFAAGVLYVLLWGLIWIIGRFFPSFRLIDLKVALRSMLAARRRGASTLLALVIGVFSLSLITLFAAAVNNLFTQALVQQSGGNVFIFAGGSSALKNIESTLATVPGVKSYNVDILYAISPTAIEKKDGTRKTLEASVSVTTNADGGTERSMDMANSLDSISAKRVDKPMPSRKMLSGRQLDASDAGQKHIVIAQDSFTKKNSVEVGDKIVFNLVQMSLVGNNVPIGQPLTYEVVGIFDEVSFEFSGGNPNAGLIPYDSLPETANPSQVSAIVNIDEAQIGGLYRAMSKIPGAFVLEAKWLNRVLTTLIGQFTSFPILVAALGLLVGGVVIANSVALTTMERRREIAIMKAVGLQRERVLGMLLIENALMGLIGGLIGVGIGLVTLMLMQASLTAAAGGVSIDFVPYGSAFFLMGLCIVVAVVAALATAWRASGEKPLNVLRYE